MGMTDEVRQSIFEPFFTTKKVGKGAGLGLATAYGIVRQSGGWIDVQSRLGHGSSFHIYLPRIDAGVIPVDAESTPQDDLRGGETVLVVEDDDGVRELTTTILRARGYNVLEAASGLEACEVAKQHPDKNSPPAHGRDHARNEWEGIIPAVARSAAPAQGSGNVWICGECDRAPGSARLGI